MSLFAFSFSYLGVDFSPYGVKVVELADQRGRPRLVTYGFVNQDINEVVNLAGKKDYGNIPFLLKAVLKKAKTTTTKAFAALPTFSVFSSILTLPTLPKKELISVIEKEAKKLSPLALEEIVLDWRIIEEEKKIKKETEPSSLDQFNDFKKEKFLKIFPQKKRKFVKILLTASTKDLIKKYLDIFQKTGLHLSNLDTEPFALIRSLVGYDKTALMIVDIGALVTNILIVEKCLPVLSRSVKIGGLTISKTLTENLNISLGEAEQFKYDIGLGFQSEEGIKNNQIIPEIIAQALNPIIDGIKYSLKIYKNQGQKNIEKIILTGGSALLINLPSYFASRLDLRVYIGDPWARVIYPEELKPILDEIGPRFSVAIGLAMREISK